MRGDRALLQHLARLVRIEPGVQETEELIRDLGEIREMVEQVRVFGGESDQATIPRETETYLLSDLRGDEPDTSRSVELDTLTRHMVDGFLLVPPVLGEDT